MHLEILTPENKIFDGEVSGVQFPGVDGSFEILNNHAAIISALGAGSVKINSDTGTKKIEIASGFVECLNNVVTVLVEQKTA